LSVLVSLPVLGVVVARCVFQILSREIEHAALSEKSACAVWFLNAAHLPCYVSVFSSPCIFDCAHSGDHENRGIFLCFDGDAHEPDDAPCVHHDDNSHDSVRWSVLCVCTLHHLEQESVGYVTRTLVFNCRHTVISLLILFEARATLSSGSLLSMRALVVNVWAFRKFHRKSIAPVALDHSCALKQLTCRLSSPKGLPMITHDKE
jgi:hypothetical protein